MKTELSSLEIGVLADELKFIEGARIQKVYQEKNVVHLSIHVPTKGTKTLILGDGKIFLTKYRLSHSEVPTNFAMYLRKYTKGQRIRRVFQHDFERIVIIEMDNYKLIVELFSKGNVIFADSDDKIWSVVERQLWSSRKIKMREPYVFPPAGVNTRAISEKELSGLFSASDKQVVALLARELSLGGMFAEEVCAHAGVDKMKISNTLTGPEGKKIFSSIHELFSRKKGPMVVLENGIETDVVPFDVVKYADARFEKKAYETFYDAVDDFFVRRMAESKEKEVNREVKVKKSKLEKRFENQKEAIAKLEAEEKDATSKAELIYEHYQAFEKIIAAVEKAGIANARGLAKEIVKVNAKTKTITVDVKGNQVDIDTRITVNDNAARYYDIAKKSREKMKSAMEALTVTEEMMKQEETVELKTVAIEVKEDEGKKWFHKYRWFVSSSGFLVAAGKDATSNEVLVKKNTDMHDIIFHTDITGSPFAVVKTEKKEADPKTLEEAGQFVGIYSRAWKAKVGNAEVYHVSPDQVSKQAPSGEYINKGSFMVYGKKNIMIVDLKFAVGFSNGEIVTGPEKAVSRITKKFVTVGPGDDKATDMARKIKAMLFEQCNKEEQEILRKINVDAIAKDIPFGEGRILK